MDELMKRYFDLRGKIYAARELKSKARDLKNKELIQDADSRLDFIGGALSEVKLQIDAIRLWKPNMKNIKPI